MRHALTKENWKDLLPEVYNWLGKVQLNPVARPDGLLIVAAEVKEKTKSVEINAPDLDGSLRSRLSDSINQAGWSGKTGPFTMVVDGAVCVLNVLDKVSGCGCPKRRDRKFGLDVARHIKSFKGEQMTLAGFQDANFGELFDGVAQGLYDLDGFKDPSKREAKLAEFPTRVGFLGCKNTGEELKGFLAMSRALVVNRFVQDAPPNYLDPLKFAEVAQEVAKASGHKCTILGPKEMAKEGMHALLSVADGGKTEPRLIVMEISGEDNSKTVGLVGKGLTFDAGGISLKPSAAMDEMKYDMSGGAAVLGAAHFLGQVKPPTKVVCVIAASENMPSGTATKPGDVVRAMNGKTIEVLNTDAEGRLVLADALAYTAEKYKPQLMIDAATLTGAVLHGLGTIGAAVMSYDQDTADYMIKVAGAFGEPLWQLPLWPELKKEVRGEVADLRNIAKGNVKAGTIIGGVFLGEFVGDTKWAHLDIAGAAWNTLAHGYPSGGSGFGLRAMAAACMNFNK